jgi:superfamily II DNA or RNA helicase
MVLSVTQPMITLHPFQREAVDAAFAAADAGTQRSAIVLPTGTGKSVVIGGVTQEHYRRAARERRRSLVIAHRTELIEQNARKIRRVAPELRVGIVKAERSQTECDVISASVQTLGGRNGAARLREIRNVGLVIIDEAHHAVADTYMKVLAHYGCFEEGGAWALGLTATMGRRDEKTLGDVWQDIVYTKSIAWAIQHGYLVRPRGLRVRIPDLDLRRVRKSRGDFSEAALGEAIEGSMAPDLVAKAYAEHAPGRQGILFAPLVSTAAAYRDALRSLGISAEVVSGTTPDGERASIIRRYEDGLIQVLCNAMLFTEGTDLPMTEVVVIGRPTMSRELLIQMVGRGLRLHPGKDSALIIDVSGATERHSLLGAIELFGEESVSVPIEDDQEQAPSEEARDDLADLPHDPTPLDEDLDEGEVWLTGPTEVVEVDLFHGSKSMWQQTRGGIWFIHAVSNVRKTDRYIIVMRSARPGLWDVIEMDARVRGRSSYVAWDVDQLSLAMALADGNVSPSEALTARKEQRWRSHKATDAQLAKAERMGVPRTLIAHMSSGELSNRIDVVNASARIDPYVPAYARRGGA